MTSEMHSSSSAAEIRRMLTDAVTRMIISLAAMIASLVIAHDGRAQSAATSDILQAMATEPIALPDGRNYVPSTPETVRWGVLPNRDAAPVLSVTSGSTVMFDTVSHEGIQEDQGRDPVTYFGRRGISPDRILDDTQAIASSSIVHDFVADGPHIVTGPVAIDGARPGDVLKVEVLALAPRVPYGVISNRHGKGALPGEFPENDGPRRGASTEQPERYNNVSVFVEIDMGGELPHAVLPVGRDEAIRFAIEPFMGIMGVAPDSSGPVNSIPPASYGGNLDINELGAGATLYLPVHVPGALFYVGDPHYAQGDGEVALTALEAPLRATFRLTLLEPGDAEIPGGTPFTQPFAETSQYWIPIGLDPDLDEAMKQAVRAGIEFLSVSLGVDRAIAYAYMSAATDFEISQVVDRTKGVHGLIRKADFSALEVR